VVGQRLVLGAAPAPRLVVVVSAFAQHKHEQHHHQELAAGPHDGRPPDCPSHVARSSPARARPQTDSLFHRDSLKHTPLLVYLDGGLQVGKCPPSRPSGTPKPHKCASCRGVLANTSGGNRRKGRAKAREARRGPLGGGRGKWKRFGRDRFAEMVTKAGIF
jgi:hypothetical protein